ncbi:MAG: NAD(P)/FAD-dependent oxidoreductase [Armatimonadota bacterium]|nr:NAD(P)/FAD-dependent oxidoreductase [Armatimonadota bacterium]
MAENRFEETQQSKKIPFCPVGRPDPMTQHADVVVVGGGAAGMVAALSAARRGARVLLLERLQRVGRKLLATGNGRCNYTNVHLAPRFYHGADPSFPGAVLEQFGLERTLGFFEELGIVPWIDEKNGRVFPASQQASAVLDVLRYEMERLGVVVECNAHVNRVVPEKTGLQCWATDGRVFAGRRVVLAAGGKAAPNLGTDGGGFRLAASLGHSIQRVFPALGPVTLEGAYLKHLAGVRFVGEARVVVNGQVRRAEQGEVLFTASGASGPPVYQISRVAAEHCPSQKVEVHFDLFPEKSHAKVRQAIIQRFATAPWKSVEFSFVGWLHKKLISVALREAGITDLQRPCGTLTPAEVDRVATQLKGWRFRCTGTPSWMHCEATAGGVSTAEVDPHTLQSRLVPNLYFAGEVLDVDGDLGGYNLQWAWSSGWVAGYHAACQTSA